MPSRPRSSGSPPAFFLATAVGQAPVRLEPEEARHALKVLRLGPGDRLIGLDGRGHRWPLRVLAAGTELELEAAAEPEFQPRPGAAGSRCPWFELAVSWPRKTRVEDMLARLVQLGAGSIVPLEAHQRGPEAIPAQPPERWWRVARESCKQSGRAWLPRLAPRARPSDYALTRRESPMALLDPRAGLSFDVWLRSISPSPLGSGSEQRPIVLIVGPEGGFDPAEREAFGEQGATAVCLGPHVLRIETAAEAAMAVAAAVHSRPPERPLSGSPDAS